MLLNTLGIICRRAWPEQTIITIVMHSFTVHRTIFKMDISSKTFRPIYTSLMLLNPCTNQKAAGLLASLGVNKVFTEDGGKFHLSSSKRSFMSPVFGCSSSVVWHFKVLEHLLLCSYLVFGCVFFVCVCSVHCVYFDEWHCWALDWIWICF